MLFPNLDDPSSTLNEIGANRRDSLNMLPDSITITPSLANSFALPFYFAVLVVIVFSLCIYALFHLRCHVIPAVDSSVSSSTHKIILENPACPLPPALSPSPPQQPGRVNCSLYSPYAQQYHQHQEERQPRAHWFQDPYVQYQSVPVNQLYPKVKSARKSKHGDRHQYKTYYELLYAPNHEATIPLVEDKSQDSRSQLESQLGNDSESWKLLARQLGMFDLKFN